MSPYPNETKYLGGIVDDIAHLILEGVQIIISREMRINIEKTIESPIEAVVGVAVNRTVYVEIRKTIDRIFDLNVLDDD